MIINMKLRQVWMACMVSMLVILSGCDSGTPTTSQQPAASQETVQQPESSSAPTTTSTSAAPATVAGERSLTIMAPAAPGGGWDQTARALQKVIQENKLAANTQVINVNGAGGTIGLSQLINSHQGENNYLMVTGLIMLGAILTNGSAVTLDQVTPIARLIGEYDVFVVPTDSPYKTLADFIAAWKTDPGALAIAGGSAGGTDHMLAGLLAQALGIDVSKVNYVAHSGGGESLASLLGGHVAAGLNGYAELESFIKAGRLRALAFSSEHRIEGIDIPTFIEQGVNVSLANWRSVVAPPGISAEQKAEMVKLVDDIYRTDAWKATIKTNNWIDMYMTGADYDAFMQAETTRVAAVLKSIGLVK